MGPKLDPRTPAPTDSAARGKAGPRPRRLGKGWLSWAVGSLSRRFFVLLALLAILSLVPWRISETVRGKLDGFAAEIDLAGSLRYRLLTMEQTARLAVAVPATARKRMAELVAEQRRTMNALIETCRSPAVCGRLQEHRARLEGELARELYAVMEGESWATRLHPLIQDELQRVDTTVHLMAAAFQDNVDSVGGAGRLAALGGLLLLLLVGYGIWEVFGRIRRLAEAIGSTSAEERIGEHAQDGDEVGALAAALATGIREQRLRREEAIANRLLKEREQRGRIASLLATLPNIESGAGELGRELRDIIDHQLAVLSLDDEHGSPEQTWRISEDEARLSSRPLGLEIPATVEIIGRNALNTSSLLREEGLAEVLLMSLRVETRSIGALALGARDARFSTEDVEAARALAPMLASALERMRLESKLRLSDQFAVLGRFSRMLAHEIRNPLNSLALHVEVLERRMARRSVPTAEHETVEKHLGVLRSEVERLNALVQDYLALSSNQSLAHFEPADLRDIVEDVLGVHRPAITERDIELRADLGEAPALANVHRAKIQQIIHNLVNNALEAMEGRAERRLVIELRPRDSSWDLYVRDSGPGLEEPNRVFSPTYSSKVHGQGIGLTISRQIARLHGGSLVARQAEGGGAEFVLSLARNPEPPSAYPTAEATK